MKSYVSSVINSNVYIMNAMARKISRVLLIILVSIFSVVISRDVSHSIGASDVRLLAVINSDEFIGFIYEPRGLFFDESKGRLYVADSGNDRLISFDADFKYLSEWSRKDLSLPTGVVRGPEGEFFILAAGTAEIKRVNVQEDSVVPFLIKGLPPGKEDFFPGRFAIDEQNFLYIIDKLNKRIVVADLDGNFVRSITVKKQSDFYGFTDIRVDEKGNLYAVDSIGSMVYIFNSKGAFVSRFQGEGKNVLATPVSIAVDSKKRIYVVDRFKGKILVFDSSGTFIFDIGRPGLKDGEFFSPSYIAVDKKGRVFVADGMRIQVFEEVK